MRPQRLAVLGLWHQGLVAAACLADLGYTVSASDPSRDVVAGLKAGRPPVSEPGLEALVRQGVEAGRLQFHDDMAAAVEGAAFVFVAFDTPVDDQDRSDLSGIYDAVRGIAGRLAPDAVVYVTAQVPVGTCARLHDLLRAHGAGQVSIAYSPENLRLGQAIERFRHPALPVIGTDDDRTFARLTELLAPLSSDWRRTNLATAETLKHALNGFLAVSICFANELGNLCDAVGADGAKIAELLRLEPRVGPKAMLVPGLGFSGGTLARDIATLRGLGDDHGIATTMLDGAWASNQAQNKTVVQRLKALLPSLATARVCVLGLTYKADTSTLRRSAAIEVIDELLAAGATVTAHDPGVDRTELGAHTGFTFCDDPYAAADLADAIVLMTPWPVYRALDLTRLRARARGNLLFDTPHLWDAGEAARGGFFYLDIGRGRAPAKKADRT